MPVLTTARAKELAWPELTGSTQDALIAIYVAGAESWVASFLGFPVYDSGTSAALSVQTYTLYPRGYADQVLELGIQPVATVTSLHISKVRDYDSASLIAAADYTLVTARGQVELVYAADYARWPEGDRNIKAVVTAGYSALPDAMELAVALVARSMWSDSQQKRANVSSKSGNGGSTQYTDNVMPQSALDLLRPLRNTSAVIG